MTSQYAAHKALGVAVGSAAAALAILPGIAVFRDGLYAPPGYEKIFGSVITVITTIALLLTLYHRNIENAPRKRIVRVTLMLCAGGLLALTGFAYARARAICEDRNGSEVYVLIFRPARLTSAAEEHYGMCRAVLAGTNANAIMNEVRDSPGLVIASNAVFLLLYITMNVAAVAALSIAGWRVAKGRELVPSDQSSPGTATVG